MMLLQHEEEAIELARPENGQIMAPSKSREDARGVHARSIAKSAALPSPLAMDQTKAPIHLCLCLTQGLFR